jgi:hypothetical protein
MFNFKEFSKGLVNFLFRKFEMLSIKIFENQNINLGMINDIPDHVTNVTFSMVSPILKVIV